MSSSKKRERELARAKYERQQARRAAEADKRKKRNQIVAVVVVLAVIAGGVVWFALSGRSSEPDVVASPTPAVSDSAVPSESAAPAESGAASESAAASTAPAATVDCTEPPAVRPDDLTWGTMPEMTIDEAASYDWNLATNCGEIRIALDAAEAPDTVNSMVFLTDNKYFDLTACHRLTTEGIFVLQCGDPKGDGTGGPGYAIPDENLPADGANNYPAGTVAMANAGPGTGGSQFFLVYEDTTLPPNYTIFGTITEGLDIVQGVAAAGVEGGGADGPPAQPVVIETATITES
ncbi:MAG: peptidylprolyl isomerase [Candidatus Nanopelagicales bacterium]